MKKISYLIAFAAALLRRAIPLLLCHLPLMRQSELQKIKFITTRTLPSTVAARSILRLAPT